MFYQPADTRWWVGYTLCLKQNYNIQETQHMMIVSEHELMEFDACTSVTCSTTTKRTYHVRTLDRLTVRWQCTAAHQVNGPLSHFFVMARQKRIVSINPFEERKQRCFLPCRVKYNIYNKTLEFVLCVASFVLSITAQFCEKTTVIVRPDCLY